MESKVLSIIMGGGQGSRLFPLTSERSKPAVPLAGKYRLVDIPISNCINSGIKQIYLLTQFNSASLHHHISQSYKFDHFSGGFVEILAAEQTHSDASWFQGTADAVRKNLVHFLDTDFDYALILSGDQLYRMDFRNILAQHIEKAADITVATIPVPRREASSLGIMRVNEDGRITRFSEKPQEEALLESLKLDQESAKGLQTESGETDELYLASMGIYIFNRQVLLDWLDNKLTDFGKHIIPQAIESNNVFSSIFEGYWRDIGTIRNFFEANLDVTSDVPQFNFYDMTSPIFTRPRFLPASKLNATHIKNALISDGCILNETNIRSSIIGIRSLVDQGSELNRTVLMGADYYESSASLAMNRSQGRPAIGIGKNTRVENAIIDKNARIGDNCVISPAGKAENQDHPLYFIRDGIVVVPKNGVIPDGTVI